jgi:hypothetical protein
LDIKSHFKQTIQNLTYQKNQKQNATHIQVDFWIQKTVPEPIEANLVDLSFLNAFSIAKLDSISIKAKANSAKLKVS